MVITRRLRAGAAPANAGKALIQRTTSQRGRCMKVSEIISRKPVLARLPHSYASLISMRLFRFAWLLALGSGFAFATTPAAKKSSQPDVFLITIDTLRA